MTNKTNTTHTLPIIPLIDIVAYPNLSTIVTVGRERSLNALKAKNGLIFVALENGGPTTPHPMGTIGRVFKQIPVKGARNVFKVCLEGIIRGEILELDPNGSYTKVTVREVPTEPESHITTESEFRTFLSLLEQLSEIQQHSMSEIISFLHKTDHREICIDLAASYFGFLTLEEKQQILSQNILSQRIQICTQGLRRQIQILSEEQKLKVVVGEGPHVATEDSLSKKVQSFDVPEHISSRIQEEFNKLKSMPPNSSEACNARAFIEHVMRVPWNKYSDEIPDNPAKILNQRHYGIAKTKEHILEYIAASKRRKTGPALCITGPPGVGKTSLARSIAKCLGRSFASIPLGSVKDPAELRGHRKAYVGASPGQFASALMRAGTMDPVIMLDELDKLGRDALHADPVGVLLEALDPEQNTSFKDHYLDDVTLDLSKVTFIATANDISQISKPLLDRLEKLKMNGYTESEKLSIAMTHILPHELKEHGSSDEECLITKNTILTIIREYTQESGVRELRRLICKLIRQVILQNETKRQRRIVHPRHLNKRLGHPLFTQENKTQKNEIGAAQGLAWTGAGGALLPIQVSITPSDKPNILVTGNLGKVMLESAQIALTLAKLHAPLFMDNKNPIDFDKLAVHIHAPEGAIEKDGPSAGITMTTALVSAITKKPVRCDFAMTGEVDLKGNILKVGGITEKFLAAHRHKVTNVIAPSGNKHEIQLVPKEIQNSLQIHLLNRIEEVLDLCITDH